MSSEKLILSIPWLMRFAKWQSIVFADNITILGGILSEPGAY